MTTTTPPAPPPITPAPQSPAEAGATAPTTYLPREHLPASAPDPARVRFGASPHERLAVPGAFVAAVSLALVVGPVLGLFGTGWVPVTAFVFFLVAYATLISLDADRRAVGDRVAQVLLWAAGAAVVTLVTMVIGYVAFRGWGVFKRLDWTDWSANFLTTDMSVTGPLRPITEGGVLHAIVGTLQQIGIALIITVPLGTATAVFLNEVKGRYSRFVRTVVEAMTALPSVVAGLFIYATVILLFTKQYNGFAASLAITVLMLPIMIRSADVVLRLVPGNLREAGLALGGGQWAVVKHVVLPTVRSGLATAVILGTAHGIGETAPVLLTAGVTSNLNLDPFNGPQVSLPLAALEFIKAPQPDMKTRGFATATLLLVIVLVLFVIARLIGGQRAGELTPRQLRRRASRSRRDQARVEANYEAIRQQIVALRGSQPHPTTTPSGDHR